MKVAMLSAFDAGRLLPTRTMVLGRRKNIPAPSMQRHTMRVVLVIKSKKYMYGYIDKLIVFLSLLLHVDTQ